MCVYVGKMTEETLHATNASAEECGVDHCEGELEEKSKATLDITDHECNMITDTEDNISIVFKFEGNDVKVSLRDFGSYVKFRCGARLSASKSNTVNLILRLFLYHFLHTMSL